MFNLLRTFMAVYETRSFSLAAEHLFTSQPTVSHHIQQLEHELNVTLFERNKRSATVPTAAADILYDFSGTFSRMGQNQTGTAKHHGDNHGHLTYRHIPKCRGRAVS